MLDLEKDPTPGDPVRVKSLARSLHAFADDVQDALRLVKGMAEEDAVLAMAGRTAEVFRDEFSGVPKNLRKLKRSYDLAGDALAAYWPQLERAQALADKALADGRVARADLSSATSRLSSADSWVARAGEEADKYKEDRGAGKDVPKPDEAKVRAATRDAQSARAAHASARSDVASAQGALDAAKKMAADARRMREDAAGEAKRKLDEASDAGIRNRRWYEEVGDWFVDNWDTIVAVCKVVVAVLGVIALIIGGPILGAIVLIAALIVLADTLSKYAKGQASLWDVAFAALDCIPGMKGLTTLGGLAKGLKSLGKLGLKGMAKGLKNGLRRGADDAVGASKPAKGRCKNGDPVDMVSGEMLMEETDVELPGLLPLVLRRTHLSTYEWGTCFGPSWASTLDERLELDAAGAVFAAEDGMILLYPVPAPGASVMPLEGPRWPLDWDGAPGAPIRVTDPATGRTRHFAPAAELAGNHEAFVLPLAAVTDRDGRRVDFDRDADGTPTAVRDSAGRLLHVDTEDGRVVRLRLRNESDGPDGTTLLRYGYDADGHLTEVTDSSGLPLGFTYDERARVTSWTDRNGSWYRFTYDDQDRCIRGEGADGFLSCTIAYDAEARETRYTDSLGHTTTYRHNELRQLVAQTDPLGNTTYAEWDRHNRLLSRTDPLGRTSRFTYDEHGNPTSVSRPDGTVTTGEYDAAGRPSSVTLPTGGRHEYVYDEHGHPTATTAPDGAVTGFSYDASGGLLSVTNALGAVHRAEPGALGLPDATTAPLGGTTRVTRDPFGRVTESVDATGATTRTAWTVEGRPAERVMADGSSEHWSYDGEGNTVRHTGPDGRTVTHTFTHFDRPLARTDHDGSTVRFVHDTELRLTSVTSASGAVWSYTYDPAGRLVGETDFNGRTLSYSYDAAGALTRRVNGAGEVTTYARDACGRVVERRSGDTVTAFAYDAAGRLVAAVTPDTVLDLTRDAVGRVVGEECNGRALRSTYDALGRRVERRTPSGAVSRWEWDANNRPAQVRLAGGALAFAYGAAGHETERRLGGTAVLAQEWDAGHRLTGQTVTGQAAQGPGPSGEPLLHRSYTYGRDGGLTAVEDGAHGTRRFTHDRLGRVESVSATGWSERYTYDAAGNVSRAETPEGPQGERVHDGTLVRRAGHITYVHDAQGRQVRQSRKLLSGGAREWTYTWDAEDRLTGVTTPDGRRWAYVYDGLGRRVAKRLLSDDGRTVEETVFTWDGSRLAEQSGSAGSTTRSWEWAPGTHRALLQIDRDEVDRRFYAIVTDLVGTPTELVDEEGRIAWRARTTLWGTSVGGQSGPVDCPLRFPGQYHDDETGLRYNFRRYYDPGNARYISPDPLGLAPAPNHHAYVGNPLRFTDPLGLVSCESSNHGISSRRETHIEGQHGPGAQDRVREAADPTGPEPSLPGEFYDDFLWDGDNFVLGRRLMEGVDGTPAIPNPRALAGQDTHLHRFDYGEPVGINGSGRETSVVEVVIRDGNIHTAYPI
ncbi:DUF6531 domain-containing protein [Streptomyces fructofermentans]|uniref:DUF6531 domain-containing protein n=1 Tax=Streptomyces fructofermentans TaxID=152141 RepID=UPI001672071C|nr:DUF6531 domain-containing protein [Streptomyces fructofermentans]